MSKRQLINWFKRIGPWPKLVKQNTCSCYGCWHKLFGVLEVPC